jgi:osmoprotectant transport system substrate-binding protein
MTRRELLAGSFLSLLFGCDSPKNQVTVGSKNFTEQLVLGELLAQYLRRTTPALIERRFYLAGTYVCHQALLAGRIDMYVEYTGTALTAILKEAPSSDHEQVYSIVKDEYDRRFGLKVLKPLGFNNSFAMVIRGEDARRYQLSNLSGLSSIAPHMRIGIGYEFLERPDGYGGLASTYGLRFAEQPRVMDLGLLYRALENHQVDIIAGANTDGLIAALGLAVLADDLHYFPPYDAVPVVRTIILERYPEIHEKLERLAGRITAEDMRKLNYELDGKHRDVQEVVANFLARVGANWPAEARHQALRSRTNWMI